MVIKLNRLYICNQKESHFQRNREHGIEMDQNELIQNLKDSDCDENRAKEIMNALASDHPEQGIQMIKLQRCCLMNEIHLQQQKVDCLDYLLHELQGGNEHDADRRIKTDRGMG